MTARKGKGSGSDVSYSSGRAGQRVKQFAIERGIELPPPLGGKAKTPRKKAAKARPRAR